MKRGLGCNKKGRRRGGGGAVKRCRPIKPQKIPKHRKEKGEERHIFILNTNVTQPNMLNFPPLSVANDLSNTSRVTNTILKF